MPKTVTTTEAPALVQLPALVLVDFHHAEHGITCPTCQERSSRFVAHVTATTQEIVDDLGPELCREAAECEPLESFDVLAGFECAECGLEVYPWLAPEMYVC